MPGKLNPPFIPALLTVLIIFFTNLSVHAQEDSIYFDESELTVDTSAAYPEEDSFVSSDSVHPQNEYFSNPVEVRKMDDAKWKKFKDEMNYDEKKKVEEKKKEKPKKENNISAPFHIGKEAIYFVYAIAFILLVFILMRLFNVTTFLSNKKVKEVKRAINIEDIEEEMLESDLERFLREAITQKQYKLALRIYFLLILKELTLREWINWRKNKTNREYLYEMSIREEYNNFSELTRIYEKSWYGEGMIGEDEYNTLSRHFQLFVEKIRSTKA